MIAGNIQYKPREDPKQYSPIEKPIAVKDDILAWKGLPDHSEASQSTNPACSKRRAEDVFHLTWMNF